ILDCKVPICQEATKDAPTLFDHLSVESASHFQSVLNGLTSIDIPYSLNYRLVRGLDYYSRTTFEITSPHLGAQSTIGAGGRYDGLVALLQGPSTPAIGFAVGLERVALLLPEQITTPQNPLFFVAGFGKEAKPIAYKLLHTLREDGIRADTDYKSVNLKSLLRSADKLEASYAIILGDDEVRSETAIIRNMNTKAQESVKIKEIPEKIRSLSL
ncbi:MAG TPA: histidine--tRNA ligase, partial [Nitrospiraceae bacterium]|nr:histidine--tRNA ligase [Nitrospiraceae bacterium]